MTHPALTLSMAQVHRQTLHRTAAGPRGAPETEPPVTIRFAGACDAAALADLAGLDSAKPPAEPILVAEVEGGLRAALSLADGAVIADPFHPTLAILELLRTRAEQLEQRRRHRAVRFGAWVVNRRPQRFAGGSWERG